MLRQVLRFSKQLVLVAPKIQYRPVYYLRICHIVDKYAHSFCFYSIQLQIAIIIALDLIYQQNESRSIIQIFIKNHSYLQANKYFQIVQNSQDNKDRARVETNSATWANNLPKENKFNTETLEKQEVESRILKVLSNFEQVNLKNLRWDSNFKKLGLDSLDQTALLASIEHEFTILFPDGIFEGFENLEQVVNYILKNINAI